MASDSEVYHWHQRELQLLSSFVQEQDKWLDSVLASLQWSREGLLAGGKTGSLLTQCPYNQNHFVPGASLSKHRLKCRYGVEGVSTEDEEEEEEEEEEGEERAAVTSGASGLPSVKISPSIVQAVKTYAQEKEGSTVKVDVSMQQRRRDFIPQSDVVVESRESQVTKEYFSTLESSVTTPPDVLVQDPLHVIRYIKSWRLIPQDFIHITPSGLNPVEVKSWLFKHLPDKHAYSSSLGGEIQAVERVMHSLTSRDVALTPDTLMSQLRSLFDLQTRPFVLRLWKFLHTASIQKQHMILDSVVDELTPLPLSSLPFLNQGEERKGEGGDLEAEGLAEKIQSIAAEVTCPSSPLPTLPMESAFFFLSPEERRLVYDYVVEVGGPAPGSHSDDPNLYRDDAAAIKAKLKQQARAESEREMEGVREERGGREGKKSYLQLMKEERDYRRRRQKYRARNVHITRRTPAEVMRDIINARMQEIGGAAPADKEEGEEDEETERGRDEKTSLSRDNIPRDYRRTAHASHAVTEESNMSERCRDYYERREGRYSKRDVESTSEPLSEHRPYRHRERSRSRERVRSRSRSKERSERRESQRYQRGHSSDRGRHHDRSESDRDRHYDKSASDKERHHDRSGSRDREKSREKRKEKKKHRHRSRSKEREKGSKRKERSSSRDRKEKHNHPQTSDKHL